MNSLVIKVYGIPGPQGSKRFMGIKGGRGVMVESSKKVKPGIPLHRSNGRPAGRWELIA